MVGPIKNDPLRALVDESDSFVESVDQLTTIVKHNTLAFCERCKTEVRHDALIEFDDEFACSVCATECAYCGTAEAGKHDVDGAHFPTGPGDRKPLRKQGRALVCDRCLACEIGDMPHSEYDRLQSQNEGY